MKVDRLKEIIESGNSEECVEFFSNTTEEERQPMSTVVLEYSEELCNRIASAPGTILSPSPERIELAEKLGVARLAMLACCSYSEMDIAPGFFRNSPVEEACKLLACRPPELINKVVDKLMDRRFEYAPETIEAALETPGGKDWLLVHKLFQEGLCARPQSINYLGSMPSARLLEDPDLDDNDYWQWLEWNSDREINNGGKTAKRLIREGKITRDSIIDASLDALKQPEEIRWVNSVCKFHESLKLTADERSKRLEKYIFLLDSQDKSIATLARKAIAKIDKHHPIDADVLLVILQNQINSSAKGTVKTALQQLDRLIERAPEKSEPALLMVAEALNHEAVDVQEEALDLLQKHSGCSNENVSAVVSDRGELIAPSLKSKLESLADIKVESKPETEGIDYSEIQSDIKSLDSKFAKMADVEQTLKSLKDGIINVKKIQFDPMQIPRLNKDNEIKPIEDLDELIQDSSRAIEETDDIELLERVLDGITRLSAQRPDDFDKKVAPLLKRVKTVMKRGAFPFYGSPTGDLSGILYAWITGKVPLLSRHGDLEEHEAGEVDSMGSYTLAFLAKRSLMIAEICSKQIERTMLGTPTHKGNWVHPETLVDKFKSYLDSKQDPGEADFILALLRMASDNRDAALKRTTGFNGEFGLALRYALGDDDISIGKNAPIWVAAARSRSPYEDDNKVEKKHPSLGPDAGRAAIHTWYRDTKLYRYGSQFLREPKENSKEKPAISFARTIEVVSTPETSENVDPLFATVHLANKSSVCGSGSPGRHLVQLVAWKSTIWPLTRESFFATGIAQIASNLDWDEAAWQNKVYLEPLLDPDVPFKPMALLLLVLGLAAKQADEHILALEALIATIEDGRIDDESLGDTISDLMSCRYVYGGKVTWTIKLSRWAKVLAQVAEVSSLHAYVVASALERALEKTDPDDYPRDLHTILELLKELYVKTGISIRSDKTKEFLQSIRGSNKTAKAAKALLKLNPTAKPEFAREVMSTIVRSRIARAKRWTENAASM